MPYLLGARALRHFENIRLRIDEVGAIALIKFHIAIFEHFGVATKGRILRRYVIKFQTRRFCAFIDVQDGNRAIGTRRHPHRFTACIRRKGSVVSVIEKN